MGSYIYTCKPGYHGNGLTCEGKILRVWVNKRRVDLYIPGMKGANENYKKKKDKKTLTIIIFETQR